MSAVSSRDNQLGPVKYDTPDAHRPTSLVDVGDGNASVVENLLFGCLCEGPKSLPLPRAKQLRKSIRNRKKPLDVAYTPTRIENIRRNESISHHPHVGKVFTSEQSERPNVLHHEAELDTVAP